MDTVVCSRRRFVNAIAAVSLLLTKILRVYSRWDILSLAELSFWWPLLFTQDTIVLLLLRYLSQLPSPTFSEGFAAILFLLASISLSFYSFTGTELQWRNLNHVAGDSAFWKMALSGSATLLTTIGVLLVVAYILQAPCELYTSIGYDAVSKLVGKLRPEARKKEDTPAWSTRTPHKSPNASKRLLSQLVLAAQLWQGACMVIQYRASLDVDLTLTLPLLVFSQLISIQHSPHGHLDLEHMPMLAPVYPWLPPTPAPGFSDYYNATNGSSVHHHFTNGSEPRAQLLPALRQIDLKRLSIKHVVLLTLESTRQDVFPVEPKGVVWRKLIGTYKKGTEMPQEVKDRLHRMTPFAKYLTGQNEDVRWPSRGMINAKSAFTTSSYTLKSLTSTNCGIMPLAADFNVEYSHHIHQPCLPQILNMLNRLGPARNWTSKFMQSTTLKYDKQDELLTRFGFQDKIGSEYLREAHDFAPVNMSDVNYFGLPEEALTGNIRNAFSTAKKTNQSLFLAHLTSSSHHPFQIPDPSKSVALSGSEGGIPLAIYVNSIGYVDRWLGNITTMLLEEGIFNETLIVAVGDHGLSIAEHNHFTAYEDPHARTLHVPMVFSFPGLPKINIDSAVTTLQILPTIMDLLIETNSLSSQQRDATRDLIGNYEGQSLLRVQNKTRWQFSLTNPGGSLISVRDERHPERRVAVPLNASELWRFVDVSRDEHEWRPIRAKTRVSLAHRLALRGFKVPIEWLDEVAGVTQAWLEENHRLWRYED